MPEPTPVPDKAVPIVDFTDEGVVEPDEKVLERHRKRHRLARQQRRLMEGAIERLRAVIRGEVRDEDGGTYGCCQRSTEVSTFCDAMGISPPVDDCCAIETFGESLVLLYELGLERGASE